MNPILIFKTIGVSVGLGGGITGSVFSSFQAFTKISIEEFLKDDWTTYSEDADWKLLKGIFDNSKNTDEKKLKLTGLEGIKKASNDENGGKVKEWCSNKKDFKIKKLLPSSFESLLLDYVKSFCLFTIGEKLTSANQFTSWNTDQSTLKANAGKLSNEKELESIKEKSNEDDKGKALLDWCQKTYKKTYRGPTDNLWKLTEKYCKKTQDKINHKKWIQL